MNKSKSRFKLLLPILILGLFLTACQKASVPKIFSNKTLTTVSVDNKLPYETNFKFDDNTLTIETVNVNTTVKLASIESDDGSVNAKKHPFKQQSKTFKKFLNLALKKDASQATRDDWANHKPSDTKLNLKSVTKNGSSYKFVFDEFDFTLTKYDANTWKLPDDTLLVFSK